MLKKQVKSILKKSPFVMAAAYIAVDLMRGVQIAKGNIYTNSGTTHANYSEEESVCYIENVVKQYKIYGGVEKFHGIAAEIGPGDNAGVALLMRQDGCEQVDLIDRFYSRRDPQQQKRIYEALARKYKLDRFRVTDKWNDRGLAGITWKIGQPAEVYFKKCAAERGEVYDFIVSCAVLEHLYDPLDALCHMIACLKPGGQMLHQIDFRDHGMFTPIHHELTFLKIPTKIYPLMVRNTGRPNRILIHRYRELLNLMKKNNLIDYSFLVTHLVSLGKSDYPRKFEDFDKELQRKAIDFVEHHRQEFVNEFKHLDSRELAVSGAFLSVTKKGRLPGNYKNVMIDEL